MYRNLPRTQHSYIYEVIKGLHKSGYLHIVYKENIADKISSLKTKFDFNNNTIQVRRSSEDEALKKTLAELKIAEMGNNHRNWRYLLNLKGLLLYLRSARRTSPEEIEAQKQVVELKRKNIQTEQNKLNDLLEVIKSKQESTPNLSHDEDISAYNRINEKKSKLRFQKITLSDLEKNQKADKISSQWYFPNSRTIDTVIKNTILKNRRKLSNQKGIYLNIVNLEFLEFFDIFVELYGVKIRNNLLIDIALELENLLNRVTQEFLRDYIIQRCYEEIKMDIAIRSDPFYRLASIPQETEDENALLEEYKTKVLRILIPLQSAKLDEMRQDFNDNK